MVILWMYQWLWWYRNNDDANDDGVNHNDGCDGCGVSNGSGENGNAGDSVHRGVKMVIMAVRVLVLIMMEAAWWLYSRSGSYGSSGVVTVVVIMVNVTGMMVVSGISGGVG